MCVRFRRLFDLSENKPILVADMSGLEWEEGGSA